VVFYGGHHAQTQAQKYHQKPGKLKINSFNAFYHRCHQKPEKS
jgi:hypothetical protein